MSEKESLSGPMSATIAVEDSEPNNSHNTEGGIEVATQQVTGIVDNASGSGGSGGPEDGTRAGEADSTDKEVATSQSFSPFAALSGYASVSGTTEPSGKEEPDKAETLDAPRDVSGPVQPVDGKAEFATVEGPGGDRPPAPAALTEQNSSEKPEMPDTEEPMQVDDPAAKTGDEGGMKDVLTMEQDGKGTAPPDGKPTELAKTNQLPKRSAEEIKNAAREKRRRAKNTKAKLFHSFQSLTGIPGIKKMQKETNDTRARRSIVAYPIEMGDMNNAKVISALAKCKFFSVRFDKLEKEKQSEKDFCGYLQIGFKQEKHMQQTVEDLKTIRNDMTVHPLGGAHGNFQQFRQNWLKHLKEVEGRDQSLNDLLRSTVYVHKLVGLSEEDLFAHFPDAEEVMIEEESQGFARHAWILYSNQNNARKAVQKLKDTQAAGGKKVEAFMILDYARYADDPDLPEEFRNRKRNANRAKNMKNKPKAGSPNKARPPATGPKAPVGLRPQQTSKLQSNKKASVQSARRQQKAKTNTFQQARNLLKGGKYNGTSQKQGNLQQRGRMENTRNQNNPRNRRLSQGSPRNTRQAGGFGQGGAHSPFTQSLDFSSVLGQLDLPQRSPVQSLMQPTYASQSRVPYRYDGGHSEDNRSAGSRQSDTGLGGGYIQSRSYAQKYTNDSPVGSKVYGDSRVYQNSSSHTSSGSYQGGSGSYQGGSGSYQYSGSQSDRRGASTVQDYYHGIQPSSLTGYDRPQESRFAGSSLPRRETDPVQTLLALQSALQEQIEKPRLGQYGQNQARGDFGNRRRGGNAPGKAGRGGRGNNPGRGGHVQGGGGQKRNLGDTEAQGGGANKRRRRNRNRSRSQQN